MAETGDLEITFQCEGWRGAAYYMQSELVPREDAGWVRDDKYEGEALIRINTETWAVDYQFKDGSRRWSRAAEHGGRAAITGFNKPLTFTITVSYADNVTEIITVGGKNQNNETAATLISTRNNSLFVSAKVYHGVCDVWTARAG